MRAEPGPFVEVVAVVHHLKRGRPEGDTMFTRIGLHIIRQHL